MTNTILNLRELVGNIYGDMKELENDIIIAFDTEEEVIVYNVSNNAIKAYINSEEATEYNIAIEEIDGLIVVIDVKELV